MAKITTGAPVATTLDVSPLPAPVSPFAWIAKQLEAGDYAEGPELHAAQQAHAWMGRCAQELPHLQSVDPIALSALARAATDAQFRALLRNGIAQIDALIAKANPQPH